MQRHIKTLAIVLVAQIALTAYVTIGGRDLATFSPNEPLLALDRSKIGSMTIHAAVGDDQPASDQDTLVTLKRDGDRWKVMGSMEFPAAMTKVDELLGSFFNAKRSLPVTTTMSGAKQLKVADGAFERKIELLDGEGKALETIYIGTSPSYKKSHVRLGKEEATYTMEFGVYEASTRGQDWFDKEILHVSEDSLAEVRFPSVVLTGSEQGFAVQGLNDGETTNFDETKSLVQTLAQLNYSEAIAADKKPEFKSDTPLVEISAAKKTGDKVTYQFFIPKDKEDERILKVSTLPYYFKVAKGTVETLEKASRDKVVKRSEPTPAAAPAENPTEILAPPLDPAAQIGATSDQPPVPTGEGAADQP